MSGSEGPDLRTVLRTTGATRAFTGEPVDDAALPRLTRDPVESFTTVDRHDGEPFTG